MGNDGLPISLVVLVAAVIVGGLIFVGWIVATILTHVLTATPGG
jgi:hypothetical protein